ncbi:hypothetical protein T09_8880 [Trichinella sp. T9]|nr:hypothetical protein T09_8880 [Trichinella sp. T9]KRZ95665.1 hypothetical protein T08_7026 [Trichinella sp. T8]
MVQLIHQTDTINSISVNRIWWTVIELDHKQASNRRSRSESGFFRDFQGPTVRTLSLRIELALYHRSLFSIVINELPDAPASITSDRRQSN